MSNAIATAIGVIAVLLFATFIVISSCEIGVKTGIREACEAVHGKMPDKATIETKNGKKHLKCLYLKEAFPEKK